MAGTSSPRHRCPVRAAHGVSLGEAFRVWLRVAALSFGGPAGQIAVMHRIIVDEKKWIGEARFLHALSYCMLLPGPEAQQLATYIGWLMHRWPGGDHRRRPVRAARLRLDHGPELHLRRFRQCAGSSRRCSSASRRRCSRSCSRRCSASAAARSRAGAMLGARGRSPSSASSFSACRFPLIVLRRGVIGFVGARSGSSAFQVGGHGHWRGRRRGAVESLLGEELPEHARPTVARRLRVSAIWLSLWLVPVIAIIAVLRRRIDVFSADRRVLLEDGRRHLRRRLRRARLCGAAGGRDLWLAAARRDARRARHGRDHAGAADHGRAVRRLPRGVPASGHAAADARRHPRRTAGDLVHFRAVLPVDLPRRALHRAAARQQAA